MNTVIRNDGGSLLPLNTRVSRRSVMSDSMLIIIICSMELVKKNKNNGGQLLFGTWLEIPTIYSGHVDQSMA